ncbi:MAG: ATP-binding protein [Bacteroidales bacterium]
MHKRRIIWVLLLVSVCLLIISGIANYHKYQVFDLERKSEHAQNVFLARQSSSAELLQQIKDSVRIHSSSFFRNERVVEYLYQRYYEHAEVLVCSVGDSILFLSNNAVPLDHNQLPGYVSGIVHLRNGWYDVKQSRVDDYTLWVVSLIKKDFRYNNRFLVNAFTEGYRLPDFVDISVNAAHGVPIYNKNGDYAFSLSVSNDQEILLVSKSVWVGSVLLAVAGFLFFLAFVYVSFMFFFNRGQLRVAVGAAFALLLVFRMLTFWLQIPAVFYEGVFFSAHHFAASYWLPSLGDLLLNSVFISFLLGLVFTYRKKISVSFSVKGVAALLYFLGLILPFAASWFLISQLQGLVMNSSLNLDVNFIFSPDVYNVIGYVIIALFFVSYYFLFSLVFYFSRILKPANIPWWTEVLVFLLVGSVGWFMISSASVFFLWYLLGISSLSCFFRSKSVSESITFTPLIFAFFILALAGTWALNVFNQEKENSKRQNLALRLASEQDPIAEYLFSEIADDLFQDHFLFQLIKDDPYNEEAILNYLKVHYFDDFWAKYDIHVTVCAPGEVWFFKPIDQEMVCDDYFQYYITDFGRPSHEPRFIYIDNNSGRNSYISVVPVTDLSGEVIIYTLYLEFEARFIPREMGFPELLVDDRIDISRNLGNYSYAIFKNGIMTFRFGPFFYSIHSYIYNVPSETFFFADFEGYNHLFFNRDADTLIIVSKPNANILERIAPFSYLFIILFLFSLCIWFTVLKLNNEFRFSLNFKKRLQFSVIGIVLVAVVAIGSASAWFIFNIYKNKNEAIINEKAHSILIEMENLLADETILNHTYHDYLRQLLLRLSNVFFTDINLFDPSGNLLASSRPRVFEEGLISPIMHPLAFNRLKISKKTMHVHQESIGNLEYISIYVPLSNLQGELLAYINLPYFAQQSELRNEISYFLVAFINIYLLLLLLSVIIAFFISNYVTRPLQIIRDSMSMIRFGKHNKKIEWEREDEIGQLVTEYNRMIEELAVSAELLARSERESAWREMAKQVAHEIKNPLTPMRLNVQYLQRAWLDRTDDWDDRLERFTRTMVEQIDNLALIASEFSDFAKMPQARMEEIDLRKFIPETVDLYKGFDKLILNFNLPQFPPKLLIIADGKQLLRVFNNLIKNAIQAYDKNQDARVEIVCVREEFYYQLIVKDYGMGIPENLKQNIFQPYFTTKTAGMGLGLAMVKSIIESFNGHISFDSSEGRGTSFTIRIPAAKQA